MLVIMRVPMAVSLPAVLEELGIDTEDAGIVCKTPGIISIGIVRRCADGTLASPIEVGTHIWHAQPGWAPIDRMELERWLVDAPIGKHWFVSQRKLIGIDNVPTIPGVELTIWNEGDLAKWLGDNLLNGKLNLSIQMPQVSDTLIGISERTVNSTPPPKEATALKPMVKLADWLSQRGFERLQVRPVLLEARLWSIDGFLVGPEESKERNRWSLIEDPFTGKLEKMGDIKTLPFVPQLEQIRPENWMTMEMVRSSLSEVCEERRHWRVSQPNQAGRVQGSILHWWRIDETRAELVSSPVLLPGWQVNFPGNGWMIVHGLSGEIVNSPSLP